MDTTRALDVTVGSLALALAAPVLIGVGMAMRLSGDHGPFLYRARRVGEGGGTISVFKVRTMACGARGSALTSGDDPRVTHLGRLLRDHRIDELPQLINVVRGEMSLVGPRPEDPVFVDWSDPLHRRVFMEKPGITGPAQLAFRGEARLLTGPDIERHYREEILPAKLALDARYLDERSLWLDLRLIARTIAVLVS